MSSVRSRDGARFDKLERTAHDETSWSLTSSRVTGRCSLSDRVAASAIQLASTASATVHGNEMRPATRSVKAASSDRKAAANRSMKNVWGVPAGKVTPGSVDRIGHRSSRPAAMESAEPWTSMRTSYPCALYRVLETTASAPEARGENGGRGVHVTELGNGGCDRVGDDERFDDGQAPEGGGMEGRARRRDPVRHGP